MRSSSSRLDLDALRDQLRATEEDLVVKTTATREAERALIRQGIGTGQADEAFDERLTLEDLQKPRSWRCGCKSRRCTDGSPRPARSQGGGRPSNDDRRG